VITRTGERSPDSSSDFTRLDGDLLFNGAQKGGYFEFFRLLMEAVTDMAADVRAGLATDYREPPEAVDPVAWLAPFGNEPTPTTGVCEPETCGGSRSSSSDDVSRTLPGILGDDERPRG
jgi:hypothetical protein